MRPPVLADDPFVAHCERHGALAAHCREVLVEEGFVAGPVDLSGLHRHLAPGHMELDDHYLNEVSRAFYRHPPDRAYRDVVRWLATLVDFDFLFQAAPIFRFHFPVPFPSALRGASGRGIQHHSDLLGGHPPEMVNAWLALTPARASAALQLSSRHAGAELLAGFEGDLDAFRHRLGHDEAFEREVVGRCRPLAMEAGDVVLFDPRCIHGGAENREDATRVSIDFRLVPLPGGDSDFEDELAARHPRWRRGEILHPESARSLR